jgi:hypothetical protein
MNDTEIYNLLDNTPPPVFICGFPGGGTDLLKNILNSHPEIYINGEMPFLYNLSKYGYKFESQFKSQHSIEKLRNLLMKLDQWGNLENINTSINVSQNKWFTLQNILRYFFNNSDRKIWGNKTPQNSENISSLKNLFPSSKFILIVRDVRDICLSWKQKWGKNIYLCSSKWSKRMFMVIDYLEKSAHESFLIINYESLLKNPKMETIRITDFLGINWSENMLAPDRYTKNIVDGKHNYGKEILPNNIRKWEKHFSRKQVKRIEEISFTTMNKFGYVPLIAISQKNISKIERVFGIVQDIFATIFIGNRYSNKNKLMDRIKMADYEFKKILRKL